MGHGNVTQVLHDLPGLQFKEFKARSLPVNVRNLSLSDQNFHVDCARDFVFEYTRIAIFFSHLL